MSMLLTNILYREVINMYEEKGGKVNRSLLIYEKFIRREVVNKKQ
ncbi:hypothetical protein NT01CX_2394 [Clostridium novyi NT]|uniref:Uncharacterized protein n=1 Tax=Clostridium novyi (strain NT) TaxID=386415 RepID=A0Q1G5_CLONN|nr:hypothetical protein NT01CX_2394 [Clostridium novyi NT]